MSTGFSRESEQQTFTLAAAGWSRETVRVGSASAWPELVGAAARLSALGFFALVAASGLVEPGGWPQAVLVLVVAVGSAWIGPMLAAGYGPSLPAEACCPDCGGELGPWSAGYRRLVRFAGEIRWLRLTRGRCRACARTHALLPSFLLAYRRDVADTVGAALLGAASGRGHRALAATLGLPAETVRGWLRRARETQATRRARASLFGFAFALGADPPRPPPIPDPLLWLLDAVASAHERAWARYGPPMGGPWNLASALTRGRLLGTPDIPPSATPAHPEQE